MKRYLQKAIQADALTKKKMAFVSGPRQVGKTTLAKALIPNKVNYFLFDDDAFRRAWIKSPEAAIATRERGAIVLDEIHKDRLWKRRLKGLYDRLGEQFGIMVTGSARLDFYRRGGDSLLGRYLPYRLHALSLAEAEDPPTPDVICERRQVKFSWQDLLELGGFPEPTLSGSKREAVRWSRLRLDRLVYEDARDFRNISDQQAFRNLIALVPERVGSLLSINALHEDVGKAYATIRSWFQVLDALYFVFTVRPYAKQLKRANRADPKLYLYDILQIPNVMMAKRRENLTALHLLKACHYWTDTAQGEFDLRFIRTKEGREVDFVVLRDGQPWLLVECKTSSLQPSSDLIHFRELLKPRFAVQLVERRHYERDYPAYGLRVVDYERFFSGWV